MKPPLLWIAGIGAPALWIAVVTVGIALVIIGRVKPSAPRAAVTNATGGSLWSARPAEDQGPLAGARMPLGMEMRQPDPKERGSSGYPVGRPIGEGAGNVWHHCRHRWIA
jgi:hypothetical protein